MYRRCGVPAGRTQRPDMAGFQDIVGQEQLKAHLQGALETQKVSHAYIINGEKSSGKEFIARIFATALQCEQGDIEPCGQCHSCRQALSGNQPDIIYVSHEKPNTISVDDIRTQVNNDVAIKPYSSRYKVYIINEAEKMTPQAQNALLKTLEEPPEYAVILLLVSNVNTLLPTILSRCVLLNMKPVRDALVKKYLMEEMQVSCHQLENGVAQEKVYQDFGKRCGEMRYRRLSFLLAVQLKQGNDQLLTLLEKETNDPQEERKNLARKAGEEAGTKLLLPMLLMLVVVMLLVLLPAYTGFGNI